MHASLRIPNYIRISLISRVSYAYCNYNRYRTYYKPTLYNSITIRNLNPLFLHRQYNSTILQLCSLPFNSHWKTQLTNFSSETNSSENSEEVHFHITDRDGDRFNVSGEIGEVMLFALQRHDIDIEGACEASLACTTCHVYLETPIENIEIASEEEEDLLDLAPFLQENSRLCCQIKLSREFEGAEIKLPSATRNFYVDGEAQKSH